MRQAVVGAMLNDYWTWWCDQMLSFVPRRLRQGDEDAGDALVIESIDAGTPQVLTAWVRRRGRVEPLGDFTPDHDGLQAMRTAAGRPAAVHLVPPHGLMMEKRVFFPLASEREIDNVVAFAMDRETPFTAEEVWWVAEVEDRDKAEGKLTLRLSLVPRDPLAGILSLLEREGFSVSAVAATAEDGRRRQIPLVGAKALGGAWHRRMMPLATAVCALLVLAVSAAPFVRQAIALSAVERRIAEVTPRFEQASQLKRRIEGSGSGGDILAFEMARLGDPLKVLAAATKALPDDTYLTEFTMHQRQVSMVGQSADAAGLIGALSRDAAFKDPAFAAPVTRMRDANRDLFSIKVEALP
jgi:general secretion pathway protein L